MKVFFEIGVTEECAVQVGTTEGANLDLQPTKGRKIYIPDAVYKRLRLAALEQHTSISAIVCDVLEATLPKLTVTKS